MDAGRKLDVLIAERVFDLQVTWLSNLARNREPWLLDQAVVKYSLPDSLYSHWMNRGIRDDGVEVWHSGGMRVPAYSMDIAAAWSIVVYFKQHSIPFSIKLTSEGYRAQSTRPIKTGVLMIEPLVYGVSDNPAHAIVLCALARLEGSYV